LQEVFQIPTLVKKTLSILSQPVADLLTQIFKNFLGV
jgi:hypothetical protein